jgi:hypothetical protein
MTTSARQAGRRPSKKGGPALGLLVALLAVVVGAGLVNEFWPRRFPAEALPDMNGNPVVPDDPAILDPDVIAAMSPEARLPGLRVVLEAVGLDAPLGAMTAVGEAVNPPGFDAVYWVRNLGVGLDHAAEGTVYLAAHALDAGGVAPGNYLVDVPLGVTLWAGEVAYSVTETRTIPKAEIGSDAGLWANTPGRIVLLTCHPNSGENRVVIGELKR